MPKDQIPEPNRINVLETKTIYCIAVVYVKLVEHVKDLAVTFLPLRSPGIWGPQKVSSEWKGHK